MIRIVLLSYKLCYFILGIILCNLCLMSCVNLPQTGADSVVLNTSTSNQVSLPLDWNTRWLKGIPCKIPCWENITPGISTVSETVEILQTITVIRSVNLQTNYLGDIVEPKLVLWHWIDDTNHDKIPSNGISMARAKSNSEKEIISDITLNLKINFSDVLRYYGEPSYIYITIDEVSSRVSEYYYTIYILYLSDGLLLVSGNKFSHPPELTPILQFDSIHLFENSVQGLKDNFMFDVGTDPANLETFIRWQGFKSFEFYCRQVASTDKSLCGNTS